MDGYTQLAEIINAHGYELARRAGELPTPEQVAADWYDTVYLPGLDAAATHAHGVKQHERSRRQSRREGSRPLPQRPPQREKD